MKIRIIGPLLCIAILVPWCRVAGADEAKKDSRTVTVQGQGKIQAIPDIATLSVGVSQDGSSAEAVSAKVRDAIGQVLAAIKAQGIPDKDVQTQFYEVQPKWEWTGGRQQRAGFTVSNQVAIKVHDLKKVGRLLAVVTDAGATSVNGPNFGFDNPQELERQALVKAMEDAKDKAAALAQAAGASLGEVTTIDQGGPVAWPGPRPLFASHRAMAAQAVPSEPIETGEQNFTSNISVTFTLR
jgi:uncharacterized protein